MSAPGKGKGRREAGDLTVIGAGAGSGKTYRVCLEIADRVAAGLDPARVLATTFTRKAAAELKGRIQERLLSEEKLAAEERIARAERLELALIGTVHSVGHQLLRRYALDLGLSPELEVLEEENQERHLNRLLAESDPEKWDELIEIARRLSHDNPHETALELLQAKRTNAIGAEPFREQMRESADRLCRILAPEDVPLEKITMEDLFDEAKRAAGALESFTSDKTKLTAGAIEKASILARRRTGRWSDFLTAATMAAGKRSGADGALEPLREIGRSVRRAAALHADIRRFCELLAERTIELEDVYGRYKSERALLDFTDLEVRFLELLLREDLEESLRAELAFVVVDEFQDTNPIQLALFLELRRLAGESVWVGDAKQAIYGFRGTDAELMSAAWSQVPGEVRRTLPKNYRSRADLVRVANEIFAPVFGDDARLEPVRKEAPRSVERWRLLSAKRGNKENDARAIALGIRDLTEEGVAAREIAVLARTHESASCVADALGELGIPALLGRPGLLYTREGALVLAALRLVADRRDSLAAATILHISGDPRVETPAWLEERLRETRDSKKSVGGDRTMPWPDDPLFDALSTMDHNGVEPYAVMSMVIETLGVAELLPKWGEPAKRSANLDALVDMAADYQSTEQQRGGAATLTGLITFLENAAGKGEDERGAAAGVDAVTISTYHGAKGLEWPVVILTDLDKERPPDLWHPSVSGGNAGEGRPLEGRTLRFWPWPFGSTRRGPRTGSDLEKDVFTTPEGVRAARLDDEEKKRLLYVGFTRAKEKVVLAHRPGKHRWLDRLGSVGKLLGEGDAAGDGEEREIAGCATTMQVRSYEPEEEVCASPAAGKARWLKSPAKVTTQGTGRAKDHAGEKAPPPGRWYSPSSAEPVLDAKEAARRMTVEKLPGENPFPKRVETDRPEMLGNAFHAYFAALPSMRRLERGAKAAVAARCLAGFGVEDVVDPEAVVAAGERLEAWIESTCPGATWHVEVPVTGPRDAGGNWGGFIDLLLELPDGKMLVVDHKTVTGPDAREPAALLAKYSGQLAAYRSVIGKTQGIESRVVLHHPCAGLIMAVFPPRTGPIAELGSCQTDQQEDDRCEENDSQKNRSSAC